MNVGELKKILKDIPDDVNIFIEDMENFSTQEFDVSTYYDGDTWIDFIMNVYIGRYRKEDDEEDTILY